MKKCFLLLIFLSFGLLASSQIKITWADLADVKFNTKFSPDVGANFMFPTFGNRVKSFQNKEVIISGYVIPIDLENGLFVLSAVPNAACFFCGGAGPESVMSLKLKSSSKRFKTDDFLTFKGTLRLNATDIYEMNYVLDNAELVVR